jgi:hypothetical protein
MPQPSAAQPTQPAPRNPADVLARYGELRQRHQSQLDALRTRQRRFIQALAAVAVLILFVTSKAMRSSDALWPLLLSFAAVAVLVVLLLRLQGKLARVQRLVAFYDRSIARADGTEPHSSLTGEQAAEGIAEPHLYRHDLDIVGPNSLFSLLATVRTGIGERGLARYLLAPATHQEALERQQAVQELLPRTDLRERIALLGQSSFQQLSAAFFDEWLADEPPRFHPVFRYALAVTAAISASLIVAGLLRLLAWGDLWPNLAAVLAVQGAIAFSMRKRALPLLEGGARLQGQIKLLAEGLELLQTASFASPRLLALQQAARQPAGAVRALKRLDRHLVLIQQRNKELFFVISLVFAAGSQAAISIALWKRRHTAAMRLWLAAWAEFETLNALATYAFEHPVGTGEHTWPELLPHTPIPMFEATALGHPLLATGVRNDLALGPNARFFLISGSNMAGKSTLMRSIGIAAVLAYAGAPVPASSLRLTPFAIGASIALTDSLAEGKSKFLAEVERLAAIVRHAAATPLLFLVDEIFSGTNSLDRRTAATAVLGQLLAHNAIGALSTHDLALTELAKTENSGINRHMASPNPDDPLAFDYLLKPGINHHSNALAIIRLLGLES